jgi:hypothetical protein
MSQLLRDLRLLKYRLLDQSSEQSEVSINYFSGEYGAGQMKEDHDSSDEEEQQIARQSTS